MTLTRAKVRIIAVPTGEAPQWVREAWVGLTLPLLEADCDCTGADQIGVLGGPPSPEHFDGFAVLFETAVAALEEKNPKAAQWWLTESLRCSRFYFGKQFCELVE